MPLMQFRGISPKIDHFALNQKNNKIWTILKLTLGLLWILTERPCYNEIFQLNIVPSFLVVQSITRKAAIKGRFLRDSYVEPR